MHRHRRRFWSKSIQHGKSYLWLNKVNRESSEWDASSGSGVAGPAGSGLLRMWLVVLLICGHMWGPRPRSPLPRIGRDPIALAPLVRPLPKSRTTILSGMFQTFKVLSDDAETNMEALGWAQHQFTSPPCPWRVEITSANIQQHFAMPWPPFSASHTLMVLSLLPEITFFPSEEKQQQNTFEVWPFRVNSSWTNYEQIKWVAVPSRNLSKFEEFCLWMQ